MVNKWLTLLDGVKLTRSESLILKKFKQDPEGQNFLQFADLLKSHDKVDESLELLINGVLNHPSFSVARVVLSRELLSKGLIEEAWQNLQESPVSLDENLLAQKLKIKLSTLLGLEEISRSLFLNIKKDVLDKDILEIKDDISNLGFHLARVNLIEKLHLDKKYILDKYKNVFTKDTSSSELSSVSIEGLDKVEKKSLSGFRVVGLSNAFSSDPESFLNKTAFQAESINSMTLASIYYKQGHYSKALSIYRKLLKEKPNNQLLLQKIAEISSLEKQQKLEDLSVDSNIVDQIQNIEIIDQKISYLNYLMEKLNNL